MGLLTVKNEVSLVTKALWDALRYAFLVRLGPVANPAALRTAFNTQWDGALCFVTSESRIYEWVPYSTLTDDNLNVIAPDITKAGRWIRVTTQLTYGPNDNAPLASKADGFVRSILVYNGEDDPAVKQENVFSQPPALLVEWVGDSPEVMSQYGGALYRNEQTYDIGVLSQCLRRSPAAAFGSPVTAEKAADPGLWDLLGLLRWFLAGSNLGIDGVDFVEIGPCQIDDELLQQRVFLGGQRITVRTSYAIPDEDLEPFAGNAQPKLTDQAEDDVVFDPSNWVSSGIELAGGPGPGFTRNVTAGLAFVAGSTVTYAGESRSFSANRDTFRDLLPTGQMVWSEVAVGAAAPPIPAGALRIACTRTDGTGVYDDHWLCGRSVVFGGRFPFP